MTPNYCISIDWLQVYGTRPLIEVSPELRGLSKLYQVKHRDVATSLWMDVYDISWLGREVATFYCRPRSSAMDINGCTLKLANRVCYSMECISILTELLEVLSIKYVGITRLDICYDCNRLHGDRSVPQFLMDFFSHEPFCEGHIVRKGSRRVQVYGSRSNLGVTRISGMRWGSPQSDIGAYCYNKTLELLEVKDKPWIRERWANAGLLNVWSKEDFDNLTPKERERYIEFGETEEFVQVPVWRFEISIKGHAKDLLCMKSGELFRLNLSFLETQGKIESLFYIYAAKVFDFRISTGQTQIKNYPQMQLFGRAGRPSVKPVHLSLFADTGRAEKMVVNKIEQLRETYSDLDSATSMSLDAAVRFIRTIAGHKAAMIRLQSEANYLATMKGYTFWRENDFIHLQFCDYVSRVKKNPPTPEAISYTESLFKQVLEEIRREDITRGDADRNTPSPEGAEWWDENLIGY